MKQYIGQAAGMAIGLVGGTMLLDYLFPQKTKFIRPALSTTTLRAT